MQQPNGTQQKSTPNQWATLAELLGIERLPRNYTEKAVSTIGAYLSIMVIYFTTLHLMGADFAMLIVASMGASAMLLFALPHAAVSQPWPLFGGQVISALVGVFTARHVADPLIAAPLAVALCTLILFFGRCLHPPGAATALTAVFASDAVREMGYSFALTPVALNVTILLIIAVVFNARFKWRRYPSGWHRRHKPQIAIGHVDVAVSHEDFMAAVEKLDTFIDVSEEDLIKLHNLIYKQEH